MCGGVIKRWENNNREAKAVESGCRRRRMTDRRGGALASESVGVGGGSLARKKKKKEKEKVDDGRLAGRVLVQGFES